MRPNNRQRSRGGRNGGGGGHQHNKQHQSHNPNRPPNRNQVFDSSGPDVRVRGNAHQVFDRYQALAREAAASGDRIMAEAYWQYADHYYRVIQSMGGFIPRNNQGWGEGGEEGQPQQQPQQQGNPQQQGQPNVQAQANGSGNGYAQDDQQPRRPDEHQSRRQDDQQSRRQDDHQSRRQDDHQSRRQDDHQPRRQGREEPADSDPGLGGVAFLQGGRPAPGPDPAADDQPEVSDFAPAGAGRRS